MHQYDRLNLPICLCTLHHALGHKSSITKMPFSSANCMIGSISHIQPAKCTQIIALVFGVSTASMLRREIFCESSSTSAKTGLAPAVTIELAEAKKVREVTITSSPAPIPKGFECYIQRDCTIGHGNWHAWFLQTVQIPFQIHGIPDQSNNSLYWIKGLLIPHRLLLE